MSGVWTNPPRGGPNYLLNLAAWAMAFAPGFAALFVASGSPAADAVRT
jgi:hypothetical protein